MNEETKEYLREMGKRGGAATVAKYGVEHMKKLSQKAVRSRKKLSTRRKKRRKKAT